MRKRHLITAAAHNLAILMRRLLGAGKPRALADLLTRLAEQLIALLAWLLSLIAGRKSTGW